MKRAYQDSVKHHEIFHVKVAVASSGNNNVVAAVAGYEIVVLQYLLNGAGAVNAKFQSDGAGTPVDKTGLLYMAGAGLGAVAPLSPIGWFKTDAGKTLDLNLSGAVAVQGVLAYILVEA